MFGAEVKRDIYPPGTLYPGQVRIAMRVGGQTVLIAPPHPDEPTAAEPRFPYFGLEHFGLTIDSLDEAVEELRSKGADIAIGPLTRSPGLRLAFIRGPQGLMVEIGGTATRLLRASSRSHLRVPGKRCAIVTLTPRHRVDVSVQEALTAWSLFRVKFSVDVTGKAHQIYAR